MKKLFSIITIIIAALQVNAQSTTTDSGADGFFTFDAGYLSSTNKTNSDISKPLFAGDGITAGIAYRYGYRLAPPYRSGRRGALMGKISYTGGKTDENALNSFSQSLVTKPYSAVVAGNESNWSRINVVAGPSIGLGKNYRTEIAVLGGIAYNPNPNSVSIDKYDSKSKVGSAYGVTENKITPYWEVNASYRVTRIGNIGLGLKGSYGSNGAAVGVTVTMNEKNLSVDYQKLEQLSM